MSRVSVAALVLALAAGPVAGRAETLADAIALAFQTNPRLQQQRADQRALDESYVQARAGYRPTVSVQATESYTRTDFGRASRQQTVSDGAGGFVTLNGADHLETNRGSAQLVLDQPLYTGGRATAAVSAAEADILAGREGLRQVEAGVLQDVVRAYDDVRRDQQVVAIRRDNLAVLSRQREETGAKFVAGQVTRVDTAQAEAQLANARSQLTSALSQLQISRANYAAIVGQNPGELSPPPPLLPGLPATVDQAFELAEQDSAVLGQARRAEEASRLRVAQARAERRPSVSAQVSLGYTGRIDPLSPRDYDQAITGGLVFNQPLFTGGVASSQIRQAGERNTSARIAAEGARRSVVQTVSQAWNSMLAARDNVASNSEQVRAATIAFEGIQAQYRVALSTTLDVLIQQQTLRDAQLALVVAAHDEHVAQAVLLAAMGRLEANALLTDAPQYDPAVPFERIKRAGAVPWEEAVGTLDRLGAPKPRPLGAIPVPPASSARPTLRPATAGPAPDAAPSTHSPTPDVSAGTPPG